MAASQDSSLLFSLKELERIEQGRVATEREAAQARRDAERRAFFERERAAREEEEGRLLQAEQRRREEEARRREEQAHLQAIERAAVERARAEVEARSRAELLRAAESHELSLLAARNAGVRRTSRFLVGASVAGAVAAAAVAVAVSAQMRERERLDAARASVVDEERAQHERTLHAFETARARVDDLERALRGLRGTLASGASAPSAGPPAGPPLRAPAPHAAPSAPRGGSSAPPRACGLDGDPLNGCLPSR